LLNPRLIKYYLPDPVIAMRESSGLRTSAHTESVIELRSEELLRCYKNSIRSRLPVELSRADLGAGKCQAEAEQKATKERTMLNPWRPRDGIYATPGTNFEDRCLKASDAIIEFSERSISRGTDKCSMTFIRDEPNAIK